MITTTFRIHWTLYITAWITGKLHTADAFIHRGGHGLAIRIRRTGRVLACGQLTFVNFRSGLEKLFTYHPFEVDFGELFT
ncbi:MAG: hypothetical protein KAJ37_02070 [Candidatus Krumholzibacteria bacterium]|nr:hypothetical protein [Candidatus Krumholzibacteria bacterium]